MTAKKWLLAAGAALLVAGAAAFVPTGDEPVPEGAPTPPGAEMDLSGFAEGPPKKKLRLLFLHHSCGGQLLAPLGADEGKDCIYRSHPNGGGLRGLLEGAGYAVHEASYGSKIAENTDLFDWLPKFRAQMQDILTTAHQDEKHADGGKNEIVVFKSCFPNSQFTAEGAPPGRPEGPELTVANAKATLRALRDELAKRPETLFVYVTAPPLAPKPTRDPLWRYIVKRALGRLPDRAAVERSGPLARAFNDWVKSPRGWLEGYEGKNIVVFDYYDVLTGHGRSNFSVYATRSGADSHPSGDGNGRVAAEFVPFLNRAVRRAGLSP